MFIIALILFVPRIISSLLYRVMMWLDSIHRARVRAHHAKWSYDTVPHVRDTLKQTLSPTEKAKWHLVCEEGRQRWFYDDKRTVNDTRFIERYSMGLEKAEPVQRRDAAATALLDGISFLVKLQDEDGHWPNDYSGPLFLTCGPVFAKYIMHKGDIEKSWSKQERAELIRYLVNMQQGDGGFGMHSEGQSTMFGTVLNYVVLRLLGAERDGEACTAARKWIKDNGGAQTVPSWGKVWLCTLGLYDWKGVNSVAAEMWLIPDWLPISMGRIWCHSRIVTLAFSWLYSTQYKCEATPLLNMVRNELYSGVPYEQIKWEECRNNVKGADLYFPTSAFYDVVNKVLLFYEHKVGPIRFLRQRALKKCLEHMNFDDTSTNYICLGPVNKALNMLIAWIVDGEKLESERVQKHLDRLPDYFWQGEDGMRMSGYNGSQLWDTSFAVQAIFASPFIDKFKKQIAEGHRYVDCAQVRDDPENYKAFYRSRAKGAWNFSTRAQSWQVSDCTAEGLRIALLARDNATILPLIEPLENQRIYDAVDVLLSLRDVDGDGAWASYEEPRAPIYLELLNCAEVYKDIMVDYTYAECTSSCVHSLILFQKQFPQYRKTAIDRAIADGVRAIKAKQRGDGSWYGSWGVCFTYAAWLSTEALRLAGEPRDSQTMQKACAFLLSKQRDDGGWGEDFNACVSQEWRENPDGSQVVNTAWAVMSLIAAAQCGCNNNTGHNDTLPCAKNFAAIQRGVNLIMSRQLRSGDWKQERISGVFNGNCAIHYPAYKNNMTVWALAKFVEYEGKFGKQL